MEHEVISENYIDVHKVLGAKGVKMPRFVEKLLGRLLHVKDLNRGVYMNRDKFGLDFVYAFTEGKEDYNLGMKVSINGLENVDRKVYLGAEYLREYKKTSAANVADV